MTNKSEESRRDFLFKRFTNKVNLLSDLTDKMKNQIKSRRKMLGNLLVFGSSFALLGKLKDYFSNAEKSKTVRLIGKDGKIVEIDSMHMPKMCAGKVSNKKLLAWLYNKEKENG